MKFVKNTLEQRNNILSVMSWNIYLGASFSILFPTCPEPLPQLVTEVFRQFLATNFPERANAIARQIALKKPDLIGIQEATIMELIPPSELGEKVVYDFIDILLDELRARGEHYAVAAERKDPAAVVLPDASGNNISYMDRDVILIHKKSKVNITDTKTDEFEAKVQNPLGGTIVRGWVSVDANINEHKFRMVTTHLEPLDALVNEAQGNELLAGPGNTTLPLIFLGDFNSDANSSSPKTYENMIAAGFQDTWLIAGKENGFTATQDPDLLNAVSHLNERIDYILIKEKNDWKVIKEELIGEAQVDRTPTRLWPSDHAGIFSKLQLKG